MELHHPRFPDEFTVRSATTYRITPHNINFAVNIILPTAYLNLQKLQFHITTFIGVTFTRFSKSHSQSSQQ